MVEPVLTVEEEWLQEEEASMGEAEEEAVEETRAQWSATSVTVWDIFKMNVQCGMKRRTMLTLMSRKRCY